MFPLLTTAYFISVRLIFTLVHNRNEGSGCRWRVQSGRVTAGGIVRLSVPQATPW